MIEGTDLSSASPGPRLIEAEALANMNNDAIVFAMANPTPEVTPGGGALRARHGHRPLDYPNQINNVLCFPASSAARWTSGRADHRGDEDGSRPRDRAIVADDELREDYIIPSVFNRDVAAAVAAAVAEQAKAQGTAGPRGVIGYAPRDTEEFRPACRP